MKLGRIVLVALLGGAVTAVGATGCSLIVDFDASKIDSGIGTVDAPGDDAADVGGDAVDSTQPDTMMGDDAADTAVADANDAADTTVADGADTAVADANDAADTAVADTAVADTAVADTAVADTADAAETASQTCGNGIKEGTEACDLGTVGALANGAACNYGMQTCSTCSASCTSVTPVISYCSDGKIDSAHGETCDDGNTTPNDGCTGCTIDAGWTCSGTTSVCQKCGNGLKEGTEACDLGAANGVACTYGLHTCSTCSATCTSVTPVISYCGDSKIDATNAETCDDGNNVAGDGCSKDTCRIESGFACVSVTLPSTCASTAGDNNVLWNQIYFNDGTADPTTETVPSKTYKFLNPSSGTISSSTTFDVYMLADLGDLTSASIRFWDGATATSIPMSWVDVTTSVAVHGAAAHKYAIWKGTIPAHAKGTYYFRIYAIDGTATATLKDGIPASSGVDCSTATLTQPICSVDTYTDKDWPIVIP
jgi:cysteine-rich repeat protein